MKIAQLASTVPDLPPPEYSQELTKLLLHQWMELCKEKNE